MIGHGIGGTLLLSTITETDLRPDVLILAASPLTAPTHLGYKKFSMDFFLAPIDMTKVRNQVSTIYGILGTNDPFVDLTETKNSLANFTDQIIELPDAGHITSGFGYSKFPELLTVIDNYHGQQLLVRDKEKTKEQENTQKKLHTTELGLAGITTMEQAMNSQVATNTVSIGSELLRQVVTDTTREQSTSITNPKNIILAILTLVLLGIGLYFMSTSIPLLVPEQAMLLNRPVDPSRDAPIIVDDLTGVLPITLRDVSDTEVMLKNLIPSDLNPDNNVYGIPFDKKTNLAELITTAGFTPIDEITTQNLPVYYGAITVPNPNPFLIITIPTYDTGYDLIKSWTSTMYRDIGIYMLYSGLEIKQAWTMNAETSQEIMQNIAVTTLSKKLAKNTEQGSITQSENNLFSWIFLDETHILIIKNKDGIPEIIKRYHGRLRN